MNSSLAPPVPALACTQLSKNFHQGGQTLRVLGGLNFHVNPGERVAIVGQSGSGKTTLLQLLGGLDNPDTGEVRIAGHLLSQASEKEKSRLRNRHLGFVYQMHHLLPEFTAVENVAFPLAIRGVAIRVAKQKAQKLLEQVGLGERLHHRPSQLSGGERQRTAVCRALVTQPDCVLADEPTGNLDRATAERVFNTLCTLNTQTGTSLVVVTHDPELAVRMNRIWRLRDGQLHEEQPGS